MKNNIYNSLMNSQLKISLVIDLINLIYKKLDLDKYEYK
jgi:hypothetical protein